jgi:hypothetical protein
MPFSLFHGATNLYLLCHYVAIFPISYVYWEDKKQGMMSSRTCITSILIRGRHCLRKKSRSLSHCVVTVILAFMSVPPPTPSHILRSHACSISALYISPDNERLYSGDSSGLVNITSTRTLRATSSWKAHSDSILGVQESANLIVTLVFGSPPYRTPISSIASL